MIEHIALGVADLERMRAFYQTYFGAECGEKYCNPKRGFTSYFLKFSNGSRLELMQWEGAAPLAGDRPHMGYLHLAMAVPDPEAVDALTQRLKADGYRCLGEPRRTGDGYYESVFADPEDNIIEIAAA